MVLCTYMGLSVTRWGRLRELVQAVLVTPAPTLESLKVLKVCVSKQVFATIFCTIYTTVHPPE